MEFEPNRTAERYGKVLGFVASYLIFTAALFYAMLLLHRMPASWSYLHIIGITLAVTLLGLLTRRLLR
jgi:hypothetical protein